MYDLPLLKLFDLFRHSASDSKIVKQAFGGWKLSGITLFESGTPFSVVNGGSANGISAIDNAGVANGVGSGSYPDLCGNPYGAIPVVSNNSSVGPLLLNPGAFCAPQGFTFGNAGRNSLNNPSRWNTDLALSKNFKVTTTSNLEFRAEAFNVFNQTQFYIYNPDLGNQANNTINCYGGYTAYYSAAGGAGTNCLTGSAFLHPIGAHRPRTLQLALKYVF
jgi:hypothetical protein